MRSCYSCHRTLDEKMEVFRSTVCPQCGKDLRVCRNCTFYSPGAHWDCRETIGEAVWDKERANFCDYFRFRESGEGTQTGQTDKKARDTFQQLFGNEE